MSIILRSALARLILALAATLALAAVLAAPAGASEAWWQLTTASRPTSLWEPGDAVQEVRAPAGSLFELKLGGSVLGELWTAPAPSAADEKKYPEATAASVRAALEEARGYGAGNVKVTAGTRDGEATFTVTTIGALAGRPAAPLEVSNEASGDAEAIGVRRGGSGRLVIDATNLGDAAVVGSAAEPVTLTDALPEGVVGYSVEAVAGTDDSSGPIACTLPSSTTVSCSYEGTLPPYESLELEVEVGLTGSPPAAGQSGRVTVAGGNAPSVSRSQAITVSEAPVPFGVESYEFRPEEEGGALDTQAGSHPFQLVTTLNLDDGALAPGSREAKNERLSPPAVQQPALPRNFRFRLPAGLVGNATAVEQCDEADFTTRFEGINSCPSGSAVGVATVTVIEHEFLGMVRVSVPVFNLVPGPGEPARFGFVVVNAPIVLNTSVRTGEEYGVTVSVENTTQVAQLLDSTVTFWGVPGAPAHDNARGWGCVYFSHPESCERPAKLSEAPFLRMPTSCGAQLLYPMELEPWNEPLGADIFDDSVQGGTLDGCERVPFQPSIEAAPDVQDASTPTGLTVQIHSPNETVLTPSGISEGDVRTTTVKLPQGVTLNPGGANGLEGCSEAQIGFTGVAPSGMDQFTPTLGQPGAFCPDASKIGTVKITTPLLAHALEGAVYLATPAPVGEAGMNPFDSLIAMYIVAEDPVSGTLVKLPGKVVPDSVTGQLVSTFEDTPQLPFEDFELHFFGGEDAPLATPGLCGGYTTDASFESWSGATVSASSDFAIDSGPDGGACPPQPRQFDPEFQAGTTNIQAGGSGELLTTMGHPDADQPLGALQITLPPGLTGSLAGVQLCPEPQAAQGTCGPESLIGHTVVTAGLGNSPVVVKRPGDVYITGPYNGHGSCTVGEAGCAPFGLSIANPAEAGPFDLERGTPCDCVVVRAKVEVNPLTSQLTITSGALPTIIEGVPLDLQHVQVAVDRPGFMLNPTSCEKMKIEGSIASSEGASTPISEPFQATNCASLAFKPSFKASTSAKTSRKDGASLHVSLTYPKAAQGTQADIREVRVELPKALPSELKTLQHACPEATFAADPASCPAESVVGHAKAITPILPVPLEGPAYFVSYGAAKFPELVLVLQGYGITIDLHGETFISKGITSSTFHEVPDQPVTSFELTLPEGPYSALAAPGGKLCQKKLAMPTSFIAQNGATVKQKTKIKVTGCAATRKKKGKAGKKQKAKKREGAKHANKGKGAKARTSQAS